MSKYSQQTAKFLAVVATNMPHLSDEEMQHLIEDPGLVKILTRIFTREARPQNAHVNVIIHYPQILRGLEYLGLHTVSMIAEVTEDQLLTAPGINGEAELIILRTILRTHGFPPIRRAQLSPRQQ